MQTSMTKATLLDTLRSERAAWDALLAQISMARMTEPGVEGTWSVKDIIIHIAAYERWFGAQLRATIRGRDATMIELYGRETTDDLEQMDQEDYNAWVVAQNRDRPVSDVLLEEQEMFRQLLETIQLLTEEDLTDPQRFEWMEDHSVVESLPSQTYRHYQMHMPTIQAWLGQHKL